VVAAGDDGGDERGHILGEPGTPGVGVVLPQPGPLRAAVVEDLRTIPGQLYKGFAFAASLRPVSTQTVKDRPSGALS